MTILLTEADQVLPLMILANNFSVIFCISLYTNYQTI